MATSEEGPPANHVNEPPLTGGRPARAGVAAIANTSTGKLVVLELAGGDALAVAVKQVDDLPAAIGALGLAVSRPILVLVGGAGGLGTHQRDLLRPLFGEALLPIIASVDGAVVDGGTDSGVMRLMGEAAGRAAPCVPLVGVIAAGTMALPGSSTTAGAAHLEPHHNHFVLVPGRDWGDESEWLALVATVLAGPQPSVTVIVNGGETAWRDVEASVAAGRPVIVLDGTGRAADDIAAALRGGQGERGYLLAESGLVEAISLDVGAARIADAVRARLERG